MQNDLYITGHRNPDTDSICASIAYAEYINKTSNLNAIPIRCGELNRESAYVLDYFDVKPPIFLESVKTQICDLNIDTIIPVSPEISLKTAWSIMKKNSVKTLPVVDQNSKFCGIISLSNLTSIIMDVWDNYILHKSSTKLNNIIDTLSSKIIFHDESCQGFNGKIVVAAMSPGSVKEVVDNGDIVICGDRKDTQEAILNANASLMIITCGSAPDKAIIEKAKEIKCTIINTPYDSFTASRLITQSIPIEYVMVKDNIVSFHTNDLIEDIRGIMSKTRFRSYPVLDEKNHVVGTISRYHLISDMRKKIILVDHNEKTQSIDGIEECEILEIIDHHRIADIQTSLPIYFRNEPVGSTSTIIASMFFENGIRPSIKTAALLCAAIISDTLNFKSPTSTKTDKIYLERLSEIANIDVDDFTSKMFKAGTSLKNRTPEEILNQDLKIFTLDKYKIGVSQVGTIDMDGFSSIKDDIVSLMNKKCLEENYNILILMLTDILRQGSELIAEGEDKFIVEKAFNINLNEGSSYLPGILSRKKQIIPPLSSAISSLKEM